MGKQLGRKRLGEADAILNNSLSHGDSVFSQEGIDTVQTGLYQVPKVLAAPQCSVIKNEVFMEISENGSNLSSG